MFIDIKFTPDFSLQRSEMFGRRILRSYGAKEILSLWVL